MEKGRIKRTPHPRQSANIFSILTFGYTLPLFKQGFQKDINEEDIPEHLENHASEKLGNRLESVWINEVKQNKDPSLLKAVIQVFGLPFMLMGFIMLFLELGVKIVQPLALSQLIMFYTRKDYISINEAYMYAGAIVIASFLNVVCGHTYMLQIQQLGMKLRVACCSLVYRKSLKLSKTALQGTTIGQAVNLLSNDVSRCDQALFHIHNLWVCPIEICVIIYILYTMTNLLSAVGILFMALFVPFQMYLGKKTSTLRLQTALRTDERIRLMNEIISGIQVIKMYTWEKPFAKLVEIARRLEIKYIRGTSYIRGLILSLVIFLTRFAIFLTILVYVLNGNNITAEYVFVITAFYNILRQAMTMHFPRGITDIAEFLISMSRIKKFLLYDEIYVANLNNPHLFLLSTNKIGEPNFDLNKLGNKTNFDANIAIELKNAYAKWYPDNSHYTLYDFNLKIYNNQLVALIGSVGSGKTSFLHVLLQELPLEKGILGVNGRLSYASQEPWVFAGSIRQNILFGNPMVEDKYEKVIRVCALSNDLDQFQYGDETLVGEKGVSLSGGQKARVNLARAIYKEADIYLLDDPLSAVDTHVAKQLFDDCILNYLSNKCVVLVTHQLQFLSKIDCIFVIDNGKILEKGAFADLQSLDAKFTEQSENENDESLTTEKQKSIEIIPNEKQIGDGPVLIREQRSSGTIGGYIYFSYFRAGGHVLFGSIVVMLLILTQLAASASDYFLTYWVNLEQRLNENASVNTNNELSRETCIYIYSGIIATLVILTLLRSYSFFKFCMQASITLHNDMFSNIVTAPMKFFDTNSSGRILNRFSKDMGTVDEILPMVAIDFFQVALSVAGVALVISTVNPWLLIGTAILVLIFYFMRIVYLRTSRSLKRLEGITKSPVFAHLNATLQGLTTIRAFSAHEILKKEFDSHQDFHSSVFYSFIICSRAFGFWIDLITVFYIAMVTFSFFIAGSEQYGGNVGLAITQAISLTGMFQWGMRQWTELETQMTCVERIVEYAKLDSEENPQDSVPPPSWPSEGIIKFSSVSLRYSSNEPYVLKNLNFTIRSNEKIGIVGRTGAGKSSLIYAMFQLTKTEGEIIIDNFNITQIPLHNLRSKISIIPQEPVLFSGTIRKNLDPFDEYSDEELWNSLQEVELKNVISELPLGLNYAVSESGSNFSVGQRQLLCLARAIIRKNKILLLDEATANVDPHTDSLIQKAIRTKFFNCTVLTIAHRLHTVMDSNKILVMNFGKMVEFDHPYLLLKNKTTLFYSMVQQMGTSMADTLYKISKTNYEKQYYNKFN